MKHLLAFLSALPLRRLITPCLCLALVLAGLFFFQKQSVPTSGTISSRKLPIYCVNTESPKVSISFDAAWASC